MVVFLLLFQVILLVSLSLITSYILVKYSQPGKLLNFYRKAVYWLALKIFKTEDNLRKNQWFYKPFFGCYVCTSFWISILWFIHYSIQNGNPTLYGFVFTAGLTIILAGAINETHYIDEED